MAREYIKDRKLPPNNWGRTRWGANTERNKRVTIRTVAKGLSLVHIGEDVWCVGRVKNIKNPNPELYGNVKTVPHRVIYAPNGKEYHLYGDEMTKLNSYWFNYYDEQIVNKNRINSAQAKIYILTSILDDRNNWCFDLKQTPKSGTLKVIYDNGTVKNIEFDGTFYKVQKQKYAKGGNLVFGQNNLIEWSATAPNYSDYTYMNPIGYRKP